MRHFRWLLPAIVLLAVIVWLTTPPAVNYDPPLRLPTMPAADDAAGLIPGTAARVTWHDDAVRERTPWSVIYLHGLSATRAETAPVSARVADALSANLYEARLRGHGRKTEPLANVTAEDWLDDTAAALAAGAALGERVVVIATSTGATLATALLDHPLMQHVDALIFLSPNFGLRESAVRRATGPGGYLLTRLLAGEYHSWTPQNEAQGTYWSTRYPSAALIEMVRALDLAETKFEHPSQQRWLLLYAENDQVIDPAAVRKVHATVTAPIKEIRVVNGSGDTSGHIIAGDIMSPGTTDEVVATIVSFVQRPVR